MEQKAMFNWAMDIFWRILLLTDNYDKDAVYPHNYLIKTVLSKEWKFLQVNKKLDVTYQLKYCS